LANGWLALVESERAVDPVRALAHAERALAVARRARDPDLELAALGWAGLGWPRLPWVGSMRA
jgi:hypothetical protein